MSTNSKIYELTPPKDNPCYGHAVHYGQGAITDNRFSGKIWDARYGLNAPETVFDARNTLNQQTCSWDHADYDPGYDELTVLVHNLEIGSAKELCKM